MARQNRHIKSKSKPAIKNIAGKGFDDNLLFNREDIDLFGEIGDYMRAKIDIEDVMTDTSLGKTRDAVDVMISDYNKTISENKENRKFITSALSDADKEKTIRNEISEIKLEINKNDINEISSEWVKEWHLNKQMVGAAGKKTDEIKDFITTSLRPDKTENEVNEAPAEYKTIRKKVISRSLIIKYISLSVAAVLGVVILIRTLLPSSDPSKIFNSFYKPFDAVSPVTRSLNIDGVDNYSFAINSYKTGDYASAARGFNEAVRNDPSFGSPHFFLGLTAIALGNFDEAINNLSVVVKDQDEYGKEAQWYLGLAYIKTGNNLKATECFENLSKSKGFYRDRSEKILRRLK